MVKRKLAVHKPLFIVLLLAFVGYLYQLTKLPVFADEAIYIRWSQLIIDDWQRYLFFPLNDGKTPIFIWSLILGQLSDFDPLWVARFTSVVCSLLLITTVGGITQLLGGSKRTAVISSILATVLPFWFFSGRLALIDQMVTLWIALSIWSFLKYLSSKDFWFCVLSGLFLGLSLWTKLSAILAFPMIGVMILLHPYILRKKIDQPLVKKVVIGSFTAFGLGLGLFLALKLQPAFGQLFSRGGDFLYPLAELTGRQIFLNIFNHGRDFLGVFSSYLTPSALLVAVSAIFLPKHRRQILVLSLSALAFCLPIMVMGKVIYPRYLLVAALPITLAISFAIENFIVAIQGEGKMVNKIFLSFFFALMIAHSISYTSAFWLYAWINPNRLPLTKADKEQYLSEWSAGNGLSETASAILEVSKSKKILVLTEGYFGTLPDGILLYLHNKNVENIFVEGIGQPVRAIPPKQIEQSKNFDVVWLVVNSHRLDLSPAPSKLVARYCRLPGDPCLEVWDITNYP